MCVPVCQSFMCYFDTACQGFRLAMSPALKAALLKLGHEQEQHTSAAADKATHKLRVLFDGADTDGTGALDLEELAVVVKKYYEAEGKSRSSKVVQKEVHQAMQAFDIDSTGTLCFTEFFRMVRDSEQLKFGFGKHELVAMTRAVQQMEANDLELAMHTAEKIRAMFSEADKDGSGTLDAEELAALVRRYYGTEGKSRSAKVVQREVSDAMGAFDTDGNGLLSFAEFLVLAGSDSFSFPWAKSVKQKLVGHATKELEVNTNLASAAREKLHALFTAADTDGSGTLSNDELTKIVKKYYGGAGKSRSTKAVQREVDEALEAYDADADGVLSFDEFLQMVITNKSFNFGDVLPIEAKILLSAEMQRFSPTATPVASPIESKGACYHCKELVLSNQPRMKCQGAYIHRACADATRE